MIITYNNYRIIPPTLRANSLPHYDKRWFIFIDDGGTTNIWVNTFDEVAHFIALHELPKDDITIKEYYNKYNEILLDISGQL